MKRLLKIAAVVVVLGLAVVAVGGAVTSAQEGDGPFAGFLAKVAAKLGVSEDKLKGAIDEAQIETIDEAVASGRITQEQADRMKERVGDGDSLLPFGGPRGGPRGELGGMRVLPDAAAQALGITQDELMIELKDGKSLAEVAEAKGMSVDDFKAALLTQVKAQLDSLVADGTLTQEQADRVMQNIEDNTDSIVNAQGGFGGCGGPGRGAGGLGHWQGPPPDDGSGLEPGQAPTPNGTAGSSSASGGTA
jgi:polyhydroxyalkanoate synthesis regulator phasin